MATVIQPRMASLTVEILYTNTYWFLMDIILMIICVFYMSVIVALE